MVGKESVSIHATRVHALPAVKATQLVSGPCRTSSKISKISNSISQSAKIFPHNMQKGNTLKVRYLESYYPRISMTLRPKILTDRSTSILVDDWEVALSESKIT